MTTCTGGALPPVPSTPVTSMRPIRLLAALGLLGLLQPRTALFAQAQGSRWTIAFHASRDAFQGGASDTTTVPGVRVEVLPAPRVSYELSLGRRLGRTELLLDLGYANGALRASSSAVVLEDRTVDMIRWRARLLLARPVLGTSVVRLLLAAGPSVEHWTTTGFTDHDVIGGHFGAILRIGQGRVSYENQIFFGLSGSPFEARDVQAPSQRESLKTWSLGAGLRYRL